MDVILVPWASMPMALVGWTGSKAWLRFMRQHASNCGMLLNSHFMFRKAGPAAGRLVPQEAPPLDAQGREFWPPGWEAAGKRSIECEADLFALLRIPNLPPDERNAP